jgi:large subunit ribosomal protein L13
MEQKTKATKAAEIKRDWHFFDLENQILGRISTQIASLLIGKNKPYFTQHLDCGDYVVAVNAGKISVSGKKKKLKMYYRHSGYPGGFKQFTFEQMMEKDPKHILRHAVKGMLPKTRLGAKMIKRLKVLIVSFSYLDLERDPRINRQISFMHGRYDIVAFGFLLYSCTKAFVL